MASIRLLNRKFRVGEAHWWIWVECRDDAGAPDNGRAVEYAIYDIETTKWWNNFTEAWENAIHWNTMGGMLGDFPGTYGDTLVTIGDNTEGRYLIHVKNDNGSTPVLNDVIEFVSRPRAKRLQFLPLTHPGVPGEHHKISVLALDLAGNPDSAATVKFAIYAPSVNQYWTVNPPGWGAVLVQNDADAGTDGFEDGVYSLTLEHDLMDPATGEARFIVQAKTADGSSEAYAIVTIRHDHMSDKIGDADVPDVAMANPVRTLKDVWRALKIVLTHDQQIDDNTKRQNYFAEDGTTVAAAYELRDAANMPSVREPFKKTRV